MRGKAMVVILGLVLALLPALTPTWGRGGGGTIILSFKDDISTLDPAIGYDWQNWSIIKSISDGLMDYEPATTNLVPHLAETFTVSPPGKTYTFRLRRGGRFHNGPEGGGR